MDRFSLRGQVALVTGASRGVGRGIATSLRHAGAIVYATGRTVMHADLDSAIIRLQCDHTDDRAVRRVFEHIAFDQGRLHILVNNAWGGNDPVVEEAGFTWLAPFWEQPTRRWRLMMDAGVRAAFVASRHAARLMVPAHRGLIVNLSFWSARKYHSNVIYGIAKAATDKLTSDGGFELRKYNVTMVSLYPGRVRTEAALAASIFDLSRTESPEFVGRAVAALASDPTVSRWNGKVVIAAELARQYGFTDIDGKLPPVLALNEA